MTIFPYAEQLMSTQVQIIDIKPIWKISIFQIAIQTTAITDNHHRTLVDFVIQYTPNPPPLLACKEAKTGYYILEFDGVLCGSICYKPYQAWKVY